VLVLLLLLMRYSHPLLLDIPWLSVVITPVYVYACFYKYYHTLIDFHEPTIHLFLLLAQTALLKKSFFFLISKRILDMSFSSLFLLSVFLVDKPSLFQALYTRNLLTSWFYHRTLSVPVTSPLVLLPEESEYFLSYC